MGYLNHFVGQLKWPVRWVRGVSTGALQATIIAHGDSGLRSLNDLWLGLRKAKDLFDEYPWWRKALNVVGGAAFASNKPLARLLTKIVRVHKIKSSGIDLRVGVTNFNTKEFYEVGPAQMESERFLRFVLASTAIPGEFGGQKIEPTGAVPGGWYFDGGVMNMIPTLESLIDDETVERVVVCLCNPMELSVDSRKYNRLVRNVKEALTIAMHDNWMGDLRLMRRLIEKTNQKVRDGALGYEAKRLIDFIVMAPTEPLPIGTLEIEPNKIRQTIAIGRNIAQRTVDDYYAQEDR